MKQEGNRHSKAWITLLTGIAVIGLVLAAPAGTQARSRIFEAVSTDKAPAEFNLGFTLGTHTGHFSRMDGEVTVDAKKGLDMQGNLNFPVERLRTGNTTRDCHLVEALAIDYSDAPYPEEHVCTGNDRVPAEYLDYPMVQFHIRDANIVSGSWAPGSTAQVKIEGEWEIHGRTLEKTHTVDVRLEQEQAGRRLFVSGVLDLTLEEFGVVVKPVSLLGFSIEVENALTVDLSMVLKQKK